MATPFASTLSKRNIAEINQVKADHLNLEYFTLDVNVK